MSDQEGEFEFNLFGLNGGKNIAKSTTFDRIKEEYNIEKIDFIKTDIFSPDSRGKQLAHLAKGSDDICVNLLTNLLKLYKYLLKN